MATIKDFEQFAVEEDKETNPLAKFDKYATTAEPESLISPEPVKKRTVYLEDEDKTIEYPDTMSPDQLNDAIQTEVYGRPRFNFYQDIANPFFTAGLPGVAANAGMRAGEEDPVKAVLEPSKAIVRGSEGMIATLGSLSRWFGENLKRQAELNEVEDSLGGKIAESMTSWGDKHYQYWRQQQQTGLEAPDPEMFRGSFVSNPSWTRAIALIAESVPSLATATGITFATGSPLAGSIALGLTEGSSEAVEALDATGSLDTANVVGVSNTVMLSILERFSLSRFLKKAGGLKKTLFGMLEEGATEPLQTALTNTIAKIGYDKTRNLMDGVLESFIAGAGSGGTVGGVTSGAGKIMDNLIQEAHKAGVSQRDIETIREGQLAVILKNADEVEKILNRSAKEKADGIDLIDESELIDQSLQQDVELIDEMIEKLENLPETERTEETESELAALQEMKRQKELAVRPGQPETASSEASAASGISEAGTTDPSLITSKSDPSLPVASLNESPSNIAATGATISTAQTLPSNRTNFTADFDIRTPSNEDYTRYFDKTQESLPVYKKTINAVTGMRDLSKKRLVSEMTRLKDKLAAESKGSKIGFKAGVRFGVEKSEAKAKVLKQIGELKRDALVDYIQKYLPVSERGKFIKMVGDGKTSTNLAKAFSKIDAAEAAFNRKIIIQDIKKQLKKASEAKNISIDYKQAIVNMMEAFDLTTPRAETVRKLEATRQFIEDQKALGENVEMPEYVYDQLKRLKALPLSELQTDALFYLSRNIRDAISVGKTKLKTRKAILEMVKETRIQALEAGTENKVESKDIVPDPVSGKLSIPDRIRNRIRNMRNNQVLLGQAIRPMDHFFKAMGQVYFDTFKTPVDYGYGLFLNDVTKLSEETDGLVKRLGLDETNFRRIGIYAVDQQDNGREKLLRAFTEADINSIQLTDAESEFYQFMRTTLDSARAPLEKVMREVYNAPLGKVANYFPFMTDYDAMTDMEVNDKLSQLRDFQTGAKKNVELGFTKERVDTKGAASVRIDALEVFMKHMDDVYYAIHLAEEIKTLGEIAKSPRIAKAAGDVGQNIIVEWVDLMARKGGKAGEVNKGFIKGINFLRQNVGTAFLALNPTSIVIQATALGDAAGFIGQYAFTGAYDLAAVRGWRDFVMDHSPELRNRVGDDFSFREFGQSWIDKMKQGGMSPIRFMDAQTASAVFVGAYQKYMAENKLDIDLAIPNQGAIAYAESVVRQTQSSAFFKDMPLFTSKGVGFWGTKTGAKVIAQFQGPLFTRFANLMVTAPGAWQAGNKAQAVAIVGSQMVTTAAEMVIRHAARAGWALLALSMFDYEPEDDEDDDRSEAFKWALEYARTAAGNVPFVSNIVSLFMYGDAPAPTFSAISEVFQSMRYAIQAKTEDTRTKWAAITALQLTGALTGLPLSFRTANLVRKADTSEGELIDDE